MKYALLLCLLFSTLAGAEDPLTADAPMPEVSEERVLLETSVGPILLALYPKAAPKHVAQFLKLVEKRVYNSTAITFIEPGYYVQIGTQYDRRVPLLPDQLKALKTIPAETNTVPHKNKSLSFSWTDDRPGTAESAFSILLADSPQLDGKAIVFGQVEGSDATLNHLQQIPRDDKFVPKQPIEIIRAEILDLATAEAKLASIENQAAQKRKLQFSLLTFAAILVVSLISFFLKKRLAPIRLTAFNLLNAFLASFAILILFTPTAQKLPLLGTALFFAMIAFFKLMNRVESP